MNDADRMILIYFSLLHDVGYVDDSKDDAYGEATIWSVSGLSQREKTHAVYLYHVCKDMDGLDRVRFNGLDCRLLRTAYGHRLPLVAGALLKEPIVGALDLDWCKINKE